MDEEKTAFDELSKKQEGYIMRNESSGIEIKCTEKFVKHWEQRGFVIVKKSIIQMLEETTEEG